MNELRIPNWVWIVIGLIYWISPDLLPGPIDDILVMVYALYRYHNEMNVYEQD
jgi:hypothetical protein